MLTPIYPANDIPKTFTPVVHYFTTKWKEMGYNVIVINYVSNFPRIYYKLASPFLSVLSSKLGFVICDHIIDDKEYVQDGISVKRICMRKTIPHTRFTDNQITKAYKKTIEYLDMVGFQPDCIIGHWVNPQLDIMPLLKQRYGVKTALVFHSSGDELLREYKKVSAHLMKSVDKLGFRSMATRRQFETKFNFGKECFYALSGVPKKYIINYDRQIIDIKRFVYVGTLIQRKYPSVLIPAIKRAFKDETFDVTYIGEGSEANEIIRQSKLCECETSVHLVGRQPRNIVADKLLECEVFIMISKAEIFGLVYLEAMAKGCIVIASRNEGIDGIIKDGVNGFLCKAGNVDELSSIISKIKSMSQDELCAISKSAVETAREMTDYKVAERYINSVINE